MHHSRPGHAIVATPEVSQRFAASVGLRRINRDSSRELKTGGWVENRLGKAWNQRRHLRVAQGGTVDARIVHPAVKVTACCAREPPDIHRTGAHKVPARGIVGDVPAVPVDFAAPGAGVISASVMMPWPLGFYITSLPNGGVEVISPPPKPHVKWVCQVPASGWRKPR